jgi:lipid II:glycine glycyltransferase (peptidoglycan interpeptide bridge formation enzyme)
MFTHKLPEFIRKNLPFVDMLVQPMATALFPVIANGGEGIPFGTYLIDLSVSEERLFEALHGKHRNVIKNAAKHNLIMAVGDEYIEEAHRIISAGYSKQGLSTYPLGYLKKMAQKLGPQFLVSVVIQNEKCVAAGLFYSDAIRTYYFLGGVSEQSVNGAMNFLLWETMRHYKSQGLLIFDLLGARLNVDQGSKYEGIQRFKERFGGSLISGYIWRYPLHTLKASVFYFLMRVRSFIKNGSFHADTIDQEAWKWR